MSVRYLMKLAKRLRPKLSWGTSLGFQMQVGHSHTDSKEILKIASLE